MSAIRFNEVLFKEALSPFITQGIEEAYSKYLFPLLEKSRIYGRQEAFPEAQEQFVRNIMRQTNYY